MRAKDSKISSWLNVLSLSRHGFNLSAHEFRDALAVHYKKPILGLPSTCDGCGSDFSLCHTLSCRKGGLVTMKFEMPSVTSLHWPGDRFVGNQ